MSSFPISPKTFGKDETSHKIFVLKKSPINEICFPKKIVLPIGGLVTMR